MITKEEAVCPPEKECNSSGKYNLMTMNPLKLISTKRMICSPEIIFFSAPTGYWKT